MPDLCPRCNKNDMIQKISAIRREGISTGSFTGPSGGISYAGGKFGTVAGVTTLSDTSITQLAALFQPPEKPVMGSPNSKSIGTIVVIIIVLGIFITVCSFSPLIFGNSQTAGFIIGVVMFAFGVILAIVHGKNETSPETKASYDAEYEKWEHRMSIYERIYYCKRDDICFDPQSGRVAKPSQFWWLYG